MWINEEAVVPEHGWDNLRLIVVNQTADGRGAGARQPGGVRYARATCGVCFAIASFAAF